MKELRVGIAGLGRLGRVHAANLAHKIPGAVLTAACVPGADSQAYARQELGLEKVYGDFREMVADPELDAVAIVSPSGEHCWQIEAALDAGKHVFSEKPLGVTMEQCLQAEAAVARHPELVCMLGFMRRYDKSYAYAKEKIAAGAIGTPYLVKSTGIDPEAQFQQVVDHGPERRHDFGGNLLLQPREIRRTPVDAVAQQVQVRAPVIAVDLDARNEAQARSGGPFGGLADAPHRIVVGQRKGVQSAGRTHINDCGDGKFPVAAVSGMDMQVESIHNQ